MQLCNKGLEAQRKRTNVNYNNRKRKLVEKEIAARSGEGLRGVASEDVASQMQGACAWIRYAKENRVDEGVQF